MNHFPDPRAARIAAAAAVLAGAAIESRADVVTDWNDQANRIVVEARLGTPPANRVMALVQTAVYEAAGAAGARSANASVEAAVAAANRVMLMKLLPSQEAAIAAAYQAALAALADTPAKAAGIAVGEAAAATVLAARADDKSAAEPERYRPHAVAGTYVPTATPAVPTWPQRKPWLMASAAQFRPAPPPALTSAAWARDYDEVRRLGAKASTQRSAEQTEVARFWEYSLPPIYHGVLRNVALQPGRDPLANARLYAAASQAMDDAMISIFDAKYHYNFWRPMTAIRNGEADGNDATEMEAGWTPFIDTPLHPEYPSAHSVLAAALGAVVAAEAGGATPVLATSSPSAKGAVRRWRSVDEFVAEVANARVWEGVHYRFSTEIGTAMGRRIGALAAGRMFGAADSATRTAEAIPATLAPAGERLVERLLARGVQVYECRPGSGGASAEWVFVAPEAELVDSRGQAAGRHYAGPHWEAPDGSRIVGSVRSRADAPSADAIPWLLLAARSVGGSGRYAGVTSVQRINTAGGVAPTRGCNANTLGVIEKVPYAADYLLYAS